MSLRVAAAAGAVVLAGALSGCGSGSGGAISVPTVPAARVFTLAGFQPSGPVRAGRPAAIGPAGWKLARLYVRAGAI